jgi:hypothetical protein
MAWNDIQALNTDLALHATNNTACLNDFKGLRCCQ